MRSFKTFKQNYIIENYCKIILPVRHRAAFSKFRCCVVPIRIETGRYEGLPEEAGLCPFCNVLENEIHVIIYCRIYDDLTEPLLAKAVDCKSNRKAMNRNWSNQKASPALKPKREINILQIDKIQ